MVRLGWSPVAAEILLALAIADQRRIVEAVGELHWRLENEVALLGSEDRQCISVSGFDICYRLSKECVVVEDIRPSGNRGWKN